MNEDVSGFHSFPPCKPSSCFVAGHSGCRNLEARKSPCFPFTAASIQITERWGVSPVLWPSFPGESFKTLSPFSWVTCLSCSHQWGLWWADTCMLKEKNFPLFLLLSHTYYHNRKAGKSRPSMAAEVVKQEEYIWRHCQPLSAASFSGQRDRTGCSRLLSYWSLPKLYLHPSEGTRYDNY